jgi:hypothetical protein
MTCEEAQYAIAAEWIAACQPIMHGSVFTR